ncbi:molybdate ABC transporter substrate-binding protein [Sneathiella chinensis]|uniref:molybdate ABC transporter substrate-binding protein n=1 Tax=Sneathiella chinensis TaxID=349750 RepID=UPI00146BE9A9|nr:molybdate ABC transporter substrate-binding protein [Sneathiella chinensis]
MAALLKRFGEVRCLSGRLAVGLALFLSLLSPLAAAEAGNKDILVFAASSMTAPVTEAVAVFERKTGQRVVVSFAGSSVLARQIENGAPADLFISANQGWLDYLEERKLLVPGSRSVIASNTLVVVAHKAGPLADRIPLDDLTELPGGGRIAVGDPDHVPAGIYARQGLQALGLWEAVKGRLVRAANVHAALMMVARQEVPVGIVYNTDARLDKDLKIVARFPEGSHAPVLYGLAQSTRGGQQKAAELAAFLTSAEGMRIFGAYGFLAPPAR